jgi:hypothetical protein
MQMTDNRSLAQTAYADMQQSTHKERDIAV